MRIRIVIISVIGIVIIGGAILSTTIQIECKSCGGDGKVECLDCQGIGAVVGEPVWVECACKGKNTGCILCGGRGGYYHIPIKVCETCEGRGAKTCTWCDGSGKVMANEIFLKFLRIK